MYIAMYWRYLALMECGGWLQMCLYVCVCVYRRIPICTLHHIVWLCSVTRLVDANCCVVNCTPFLAGCVVCVWYEMKCCHTWAIRYRAMGFWLQWEFHLVPSFIATWTSSLSSLFSPHQPLTSLLSHLSSLLPSFHLHMSFAQSHIFSLLSFSLSPFSSPLSLPLLISSEVARFV